MWNYATAPCGADWTEGKLSDLQEKAPLVLAIEVLGVGPPRGFPLFTLSTTKGLSRVRGTSRYPFLFPGIFLDWSWIMWLWNVLGLLTPTWLSGLD